MADPSQRLTTEGFTFDGFTFDPASGELRPTGGDGEASRLPPKPARMLTLLLERPGELVPREELVAELWPDQHLDVEGSLAYTVRQVRLALGDDAVEPRYVETLPRRGYRFLAPVKEGDDGDDDRAAEASPLPRPLSPARAIRSAAGVPLLLLALALSLVSLRFAGTGGPTRAEVIDVTRVALLPLRPPERLATDPQAVAANQRLGQRLLVALADQPGLDVVGPATTAAVVKEGRAPGEIGTALDVAYTISGGHAPDEEILFLQVIRVADGGHLHAERYAGDEAALGRRLAAIAEELARAARATRPAPGHGPG